MLMFCLMLFVFFFKQKTAYEMRISDWSSDVCSSDLGAGTRNVGGGSDGDGLPHIQAGKRLDRSHPGRAFIAVKLDRRQPCSRSRLLHLRIVGVDEQIGRAHV